MRSQTPAGLTVTEDRRQLTHSGNSQAYLLRNRLWNDARTSSTHWHVFFKVSSYPASVFRLLLLWNQDTLLFPATCLCGKAERKKKPSGRFFIITKRFYSLILPENLTLCFLGFNWATYPFSNKYVARRVYIDGFSSAYEWACGQETEIALLELIRLLICLSASQREQT